MMLNCELCGKPASPMYGIFDEKLGVCPTCCVIIRDALSQCLDIPNYTVADVVKELDTMTAVVGAIELRNLEES